MSAPSNYIPLGCLVIKKTDNLIKDEIWIALQEKHGSWADVSPVDPVPDASGTQLAAFADIDDALLRSKPLKSFKNLTAARWILLRVLVQQDVCIVRVHGLPDDVDRRLVNRDNTKLKYARGLLLNVLDFSPETWAGRPNSSPVPIFRHSLEESGAEDASLSLLQMFNSMPSPDPDPGIIASHADREAAYAVQDSDIPGLTTKLYNYQRQSAALMIQRESEPGQVLDPRLLKGLDQNGVTFYFDPSSGILLKDPRFYDGVRGGILAEQMGAGKTLICLSVILATRGSATSTPDIYKGSDIPVRPVTGTLAEMVASNINRKGAPWKIYFNAYGTTKDLEYSRCLAAIKENPGFYHVPAPPPKRASRGLSAVAKPPIKIWHSHASLVVVPNNLMKQWEQEITKHTASREDPACLKVLTLTSQKGDIPPAPTLATYDIVLISQTRLSNIYKQTLMHDCPLSEILFKRCIVDEGHKLGSVKISSKTDMLLALDLMHIAARWIVTGTPSPGLYGVDMEHQKPNCSDGETGMEDSKFSAETERQDLSKIGAIASLYLNARPWSNTSLEIGDTMADWSVYVMQPKHTSRSSGRKGVLQATLNSLLIRHQLSELNNHLPAVKENIVVLEGSYQDKLSLNVFSMMTIFNAVQSQRSDRDYFFHPRQRKALLQLLHNLKQASFFGGSFFSPEDIKKSLDTAGEFLTEKKVLISDEDEALLKKAMDIARIALEDPLKILSNKFNEIPVFVQDFLPNGAGAAWSLDDENNNPTCTDATLVMAAQKLIRSSLGNTTKMNSLLNGQLLEEGHQRLLDQAVSIAENTESERKQTKGPSVLAGNTGLGGDRVPRQLRANAFQTLEAPTGHQEPPDDLKKARLVSTVSAKLSYLIDAVTEHQADEKIIIFYENENVAWYLASMLDVTQVPHLIYARSLSYDRKMQYVNTFNHDAKFRVILMDLSQAAVGLDMRAASRIYFINPVLNPQIQAQAIGRVRRISQHKPVTVETLVLRGSIEEVIVERKKSMSQIEHWKCKSILDDRPIYNWILNAAILPLPKDQTEKLDQAVPLRYPQPIFGSGFGQEHHPNQDIIMGDLSPTSLSKTRRPANDTPSSSLKRRYTPEPQDDSGSPDVDDDSSRRVRFKASHDGAMGDATTMGDATSGDSQESVVRPGRQVRFAGV
ncbi:snf2 family helicase [Colletotrichum karsti]|uniref:Snf2 family helicase n=1 Tax=Colletotrichum karsti TaxID=1095194 RepID=A0A9P6IBX6_9PEZI|nr:snf2 family helicase [Colletotrichum karsti]KAF9880009.1 snf2 family helicase [Colletotrichum karsti]